MNLKKQIPCICKRIESAGRIRTSDIRAYALPPPVAASLILSIKVVYPIRTRRTAIHDLKGSQDFLLQM